MSGCPPSFVLERALLGELPGTASAVWLEHIAACEACRAQLEELRAQDTRFAGSPFAQGLKAQRAASAIPRLSLRGWPVAAAPALLAAAALVFVVISRPRSERFEPKGGAGILAVLQERAGVVRPVDPNDLRPNDGLQLRFRAAQAGELIAVGIDRSGALTVLYPEGAARSAPIQAGTELELGGRVILRGEDDSARICVLFDAAPIFADERARAECGEERGRVVGALNLRLGASRP